MAYQINVRSVNSAHLNTLPANLLNEFPVLSRDIVAGTAHGPTDIDDAESAVRILSESTNVPANALSTAKNNVYLVRAQHAMTEAAAANPGALPLAGGLFPVNIQASLDGITARVHNISIRLGNQHNITAGTSEFPVKQVAGDGTQLASACFPTIATNLWQYPAGGQPLDTSPNAFLNIADPLNAPFTMAQLKALVTFYNERFGVVANDTAQEKLRKFRQFLIGY